MTPGHQGYNPDEDTMSARDEAAKAIWDALTTLEAGEVAKLVDAVPDGVLVRVLKERGALRRTSIATDGALFDTETTEILYFPTPLYRVVES